MAANLWKFFDFCLQVTVLTCHGGAMLLAQVYLSVSLIMISLFYLDVRRTCPQIEFGLKHVSWKQTKGILADGIPLLSGQASGALFLQGYPLIINNALGASFVVSFVSVRTISRTVLLFNQVFCASSAPEVARSYGRKDWTSYMRLLKIMLASALFAGLATIIGLTLFGPWFIHLWLLGKVHISRLPLFFFALSVALQGVCAVGNYVLIASNMHHLYNYVLLAVTFTTLGLANIIIPHFGFTGVPLTMVGQDFVLTIIVFLLCKSKLSHISLGELRSLFSTKIYWTKFQALINRPEV